MGFLNNIRNQSFFISKNFSKTIHSKSNIILSPEYYWVKHISLNVSFTYEVREMAPSIFEEVLPDGNFEFKVIKKAKNDFLILAYDISYIKKALQELGINLLYVDKIYTAQSEFDSLDLKVDARYGLGTIDGIVTYIPIKLFANENLLDIKEFLASKTLSSNEIFSSRFQKITIPAKTLNAIVWIFLLLNLVVLLDLIKLEQNQRILSQKSMLFTQNHHLPPTQFQLKNMHAELLLLNTQQKTLRENLTYLSRYHFSKSEYINQIIIEKNTLMIRAKMDKKRDQDLFKTYILKKMKNAQITQEKSDLHLEAKL